MSRIAIIQGRLVPPEDGRFQCFPRNRWRDEFAHAAAAGLDAIEWIYDLHGADMNPLATDAGIAEILSPRHFVNVRRTLGGPAPEVTTNAIAVSRAQLETDLAWWTTATTALNEAERRLAAESARL